MESLYRRLNQYGREDYYPYHMPGHKRKLVGDLSRDLFQIDITEIDGFDNLHAPEGLILELQRRIAALYGAEESFCLVGGSTAGILSAISAAVPMGGHILMARNCHRSAYHAAYLRRLNISYLYPSVMEEYGIADGITPHQVELALEKEPDIRAVILVSPTYEGRLSPIREIAEVVHAKGKLLIVDEAHGAHLGLTENMAPNSCLAGADLVIHSIHKTLPAMTQTALLHANGELADREMLRRFLKIYQSSSPSYVLMASIDHCIALLEKERSNLFSAFSHQFEALMQDLSELRSIKVVGLKTDVCGKEAPQLSLSSGTGLTPAVCGKEAPQLPVSSGTGLTPDGRGKESDIWGSGHQDIGKLLLYPDPRLMTGKELYDRLREKYHLQLEMAAERFCLAMFTVGDTQEGYDRMRSALREIDGELQSTAEPAEQQEQLRDAAEPERDKLDHGACENIHEKEMEGRKSFKTTGALIRIPLYEAWDLPCELVSLEDCVGRISGEFVNLYPPGTPILAPGEEITAQICERIKACLRQGLNVQGLMGENRFIKCVNR